MSSCEERWEASFPQYPSVDKQEKQKQNMKLMHPKDSAADKYIMSKTHGKFQLGGCHNERSILYPPFKRLHESRVPKDRLSMLIVFHTTADTSTSGENRKKRQTFFRTTERGPRTPCWAKELVGMFPSCKMHKLNLSWVGASLAVSGFLGRRQSSSF